MILPCSIVQVLAGAGRSSAGVNSNDISHRIDKDAQTTPVDRQDQHHVAVRDLGNRPAKPSA